MRNGQDEIAPRIIEIKEDGNKEQSEERSTLNEEYNDKDTVHEYSDLKKYAIVQLKELIDRCMPTNTRDKALKYLEDIIEE